MKLYRCNKTVLRFSPEGAKFINAYSTNVPDAPRNAFVDIQGRIVAVADQFKKSEDEVWVAVEERFAERLIGHLNKYLGLTPTTVERLERQKVYWDLEGKKLLVTEEELPAGVSEEEFTRFRVQNGLALQGTDFDEEMVLNLADDGLVSYTKGCYLGQEIVARVHYRGKPAKKLVVKFEDECDAVQQTGMTSLAEIVSGGRRAGFVFDKTGGDV